MSPYLVDADWLAARLGSDGMSIVDGSWHLPATRRNGRQEFDAQHIPGAVFFDIDEVVDPASDLPHAMPSTTQFAAAAGRLGISNLNTIVVYDGAGLFSAARVWWMFRQFGAVKVVVLDGGFPAWLEARLPVESGSAPVYPALFAATEPADVVSFDQMRDTVVTSNAQVLDARPAGRFTGADAEPRAGMRSGHMPNAISVPIADLIEDGRLKPEPMLRQVFDKSGVELQRPIVTTCGSGVTAAVISLALESVGAREHRLYDGSWAEWGGRSDTSVDQGD